MIVIYLFSVGLVLWAMEVVFPAQLSFRQVIQALIILVIVLIPYGFWLLENL